MTDEIKRLTTDILLSSDSLKRGIFKPQALKALCTFNDVTAYLAYTEYRIVVQNIH